MSKPYAERARRHAETQASKADTPLKRTAVRFDQWRRRVADLPPEQADKAADDMTEYLQAEIDKLTPRR